MIYEIDRTYIDYLRKFDSSVPEEKEHTGAKTRKYIGVLFEINSFQYFAPLSSPKKKFKKMKNDKDFMKVDGGIYGAINFNNMIPVHTDALITYNINKEPDETYRNILIKQSIFIRKNKEAIFNIAKELYEIITGDKEEDKSERNRLIGRCCKYKVLEEAAKSYSK